jgi:hypothetical protein
VRAVLPSSPPSSTVKPADSAGFVTVPVTVRETRCDAELTAPTTYRESFGSALSPS